MPDIDFAPVVCTCTHSHHSRIYSLGIFSAALKKSKLSEADLAEQHSLLTEEDLRAKNADRKRQTIESSDTPSPQSDTTPVIPSVKSPVEPADILPRGDKDRNLAQRMTDVTSSLTSTLDSISAVSETFDGARTTAEDDEQLMMRDSPKWEEEEIQADETEEPKAIKAEIKLLVKTTELGKESIEIRSIREFVDVEEKHPGGFGSIIASTSPEREELIQSGDRVFTLQRKPSPGGSPIPRFVRPLDSSEVSNESDRTPDDFNLMSQVRGKPSLACISFQRVCRSLSVKTYSHFLLTSLLLRIVLTLRRIVHRFLLSKFPSSICCPRSKMYS